MSQQPLDQIAAGCKLTTRLERTYRRLTCIDLMKASRSVRAEMAIYKYAVYLARNTTDPAFDSEHQPGAVTPLSGIYRCGGCGREIASTQGHPLPPQNHHTHDRAQGSIRWRLTVFADHRPKPWMANGIVPSRAGHPGRWIDERKIRYHQARMVGLYGESGGRRDIRLCCWTPTVKRNTIPPSATNLECCANLGYMKQCCHGGPQRFSCKWRMSLVRPIKPAATRRIDRCPPPADHGRHRRRPRRIGVR